MDEAGNSPAWLPFLGLGLLALVALLIAVHQAIGGRTQAAAPEAQPVAAEGAPAPEVGAAKPQPNAPPAAPRE